MYGTGLILCASSTQYHTKEAWSFKGCPSHQRQSPLTSIPFLHCYTFSSRITRPITSAQRGKTPWLASCPKGQMMPANHWTYFTSSPKFWSIQCDHGTFAFRLSKGRWSWDSIAKYCEPEEGECWLSLLVIHKWDQKTFHEWAKSHSHLVRSLCSCPFLFHFSWFLNYQEKHSSH